MFDLTLESLYKAHFNVTYRGVPIAKNPLDMVLYQMILNEVQPDIVVEVGTWQGGSALYLADILANIGRGEVFSTDVANHVSDPLVMFNERVHLSLGGYQAFDTSVLQGRVLVIDDGSHKVEDVAAALEKFSPFVGVGSYYIVEDTIVDELREKNVCQGLKGMSPLAAVNQFLAAHPEWSVDRRWCDFFGVNATFNADGYLRRR